MHRIEYTNSGVIPPAFIEIEQSIAHIERKLSKAALVPILGTITGACKMLLGIIQATGGLLAMVCSLPFLITENGRKVFKRGFSHLCNGLANVGAGALEAIPILGSALSYYRIFLRAHNYSPDLSYESYDDRWMIIVGYSVLNKHSRTYHGKAQPRDEDPLPALKPIFLI